MLGRIFRHIKLNALPLFFILTFTSLFILVFRGDLQRQMQEKDEAKQLVIGFFKKDKLERILLGLPRLPRLAGAGIASAVRFQGYGSFRDRIPINYVTLVKQQPGQPRDDAK